MAPTNPQAQIEWVRVNKLTELTGITEQAVYAKIKRGDWLEGAVWIRAPDGKPMISIVGFNLWVEGQESELLRRAVSR